ncbi:hypothetical protein BDY17DRAFT_296609 [Neohortaea acidophila]|uniref:DUF7730 domain-containing protein n=1 Tax=Neohortaea acidophila TaxID=245834 RepID=A0A6A6PSC0_9PEZI|nr:uncharacterized protein BDY17DRAFT_296609 [Neohortaea acidophila]KAF2482998.1 hypothetical protein BDY17DRAFT_296609 [Neohortaea acidophila]
MADQQSASRLLSLPRELRDKIYSHLFHDPPSWIRLDVVCPLDAALFKDSCTPSANSHAIQLYGLLLSCRQIYAEAFHFYYPSSVFYLYSVNAAVRRLALMKPEYREQLKCVKVCLPIHEETAFFSWIPEVHKEASRNRMRRSRLEALLLTMDREGIKLPAGVLGTAFAPPVDRQIVEEDDEQSSESVEERNNDETTAQEQRPEKPDLVFFRQIAARMCS